MELVIVSLVRGRDIMEIEIGADETGEEKRRKGGGGKEVQEGGYTKEATTTRETLMR